MDYAPTNKGWSNKVIQLKLFVLEFEDGHTERHVAERCISDKNGVSLRTAALRRDFTTSEIAETYADTSVRSSDLSMADVLKSVNEKRGKN